MPPPGTFGPERVDRSAQGSLLPGGVMTPPYILHEYSNIYLSMGAGLTCMTCF